jgi:negative regulator of flagellin synthesis FlgM
MGSMKTRSLERIAGMIDGVGRMQPVVPATAETTGRKADAPALRGGMALGRMPAGIEKPADVSLQRMGAAMAASPPVDTAKVAALRAAMVAGSYRLDPMAVADAMLRQAGA